MKFFISIPLGLLLAAPALAAEEAETINWSATDIRGRSVQVPAADGPTILAFVRAGQDQSRDALEQISQSAGDGPQVIVIFSVPQSKTPHDLLPEGRPWPVVFDPDYAASGQMNVHVWPTTLVVSAAGRRCGRLAGLPASFASDLSAHLDFASGKLDESQLQSRLGSHQVVGQSEQGTIARHLRIARDQLDDGRPEQARQAVEQAAGLGPKDPASLVALAALWLDLHEPDRAAHWIDQLPPDAVPRWQLGLLRGRALIAQGRWDAAGPLLEQATHLNPRPAEALYHLGLVHQHQGEHQKAANCFRRAYEALRRGRARMGADK